MRRINKVNRLATAYETWLNGEGGPRRNVYDSSNNRYYLDIVASLLYAQNGLCAYTEKRLLAVTEVDHIPNLFDSNGKYIGHQFEIAANLEHFDSNLKQTEPYNWSNFFVSYDTINQRRKGSRTIDNILKPDRVDYISNQLLEYNVEEHIFMAHSELENDVADRVEEMIYTLGINYGAIKNERRRYLEPLLQRYKTNNQLRPIEFITAFEMSVR